jgi:hypothetical protein
MNQVKWDKWIYDSGKFPIDFDFSTPESKLAESLADAYITLEGKSSPDNFQIFKKFPENT